MATGTVSWYDPQRGVGVIVLDGGAEVPVHRAQIDGGGSQSLQQHDRVAFTPREGQAGLEPSGVYLP
jgi:cold shock CspA family protein